jgi:hypothetical protein
MARAAETLGQLIRCFAPRLTHAHSPDVCNEQV